MRRTLASPIFAISSKRPSAIFAEVLSASMRTARRGERASEGMTATRVQSNGGFHMSVAPLNDLIFNRVTIQSDRSRRNRREEGSRGGRFTPDLKRQSSLPGDPPAHVLVIRP